MTTENANLYTCAKELDVPVAWLKTAAIKGEVPCLRIGKRRLIFNVEAVRAALAERAGQHPRRAILLGGRR